MTKYDIRFLCMSLGNKDWSRIHQKQFDKMDGLDAYIEKKNKRTESITYSVNASVKKARSAIETLKQQCRTPPLSASKVSMQSLGKYPSEPLCFKHIYSFT